MTVLGILRIFYPYLIGAVIGGCAAWWFQGVRADHLQSELMIKKNEISICQDANRTNDTTIRKLKAEVKQANALCESRLKSNAQLLKRLRDIDNLKTSGAQNEKGALDSDPLLRELNGMFPIEADHKN